MLRNKMFLVSFFVVLLAMFTPAINASTSGMMAVTFPSQSGWAVSGTAGAPGYEQSNWVNTSKDQSSWGAQYNLVDGAGLSTGATMDWYASPVYSCYYGATADNDNERMMDAGIAAAASDGKVEIHVKGIPYESYDVVVYFSSELPNSYVAKYTIGATSVYAQVAAMNFFGNDNIFTQVPSSSTTNLQGSTPVGNYVVFEGVTGSTLYLTAQNAWTGENIYTYAAGQPWSQISGFQIIDAGPVAPKYTEAMAVMFPSQSGWTVNGTAGAPGYAQAHWVNTSSDQSSWGNAYNLVDNNGNSTGAVMDFYASEIWSWSFDAADNDDERMMDCGIACTTGIAEVNVMNIPYGSYDVVVYFSSKMEFPFVSKYTVGSTSVYAKNSAMTLFGDDDTYVQVPLTSTADLQENTPAGNYIIFEHVTGPTLRIKAQAGWFGNSIYNYLPGAPRASISGFQIISTCNARPETDLNVDCAVDFGDVKVIADSWLQVADEFSDPRTKCANNELIYAPQIPAITVDGSFSDWTSASEWAQFGKWYEGGNEGTTKARYAWNDAANKLYIGIESTETELLILEVGGLMGNLSDVNALPSGGIQATQLEFKSWSGGVPTSIANQSSGTTTGVQAAYTVNDGTIRIEIATPIYSDWTNSASGMDLTSQMDIYEYADIFSDDWFSMGDNQCANGAYYESYGSKTMLTGSLIRLIQSLPRTLQDIPEVYRHEPVDLNDDLIINLQDFAKVALDWMQDF